MAYETGTATDVTDLLDKLRLFLTGAGWTINSWSVQGSGYWLSIQKGSDLFANLVSDPASGTSTHPGPYIYARGATGYNGASAWTAQPGGQSASTVCNKMPGPFVAYHFFEGDDYIHVVVEVDSGRYRHLHIGIAEKFCAFTGGLYVQGTSLYYNSTSPSNISSDDNVYPWSTASRVDNGTNMIYADAGEGAVWNSHSLSAANRYGDTCRKEASSDVEFDRAGMLRPIFAASPNSANGLAPLIAPRITIRKTTGLYCILGQPKAVRIINMTNIVPGATVTIGPDEWLAFPFTLRRATNNDITTDGSQYFGFAYLKNTA